MSFNWFNRLCTLLNVCQTITHRLKARWRKKYRIVQQHQLHCSEQFFFCDFKREKSWKNEFIRNYAGPAHGYDRICRQHARQAWFDRQFSAQFSRGMHLLVTHISNNFEIAYQLFLTYNEIGYGHQPASYGNCERPQRLRLSKFV